jgi:hypothetical protein
MLEYQKSSPAQALYPQTAACIVSARTKLFSNTRSGGAGAAADDFWYPSMRKPLHPHRLMHSGEKSSRTKKSNREIK